MSSKLSDDYMKRLLRERATNGMAISLQLINTLRQIACKGPLSEVIQRTFERRALSNLTHFEVGISRGQA